MKTTGVRKKVIVCEQALSVLLQGQGFKGNKTKHIEEPKARRPWAGLHRGAEVSGLVASDSVRLTFVTLLLCTMWNEPKRILH